MKAAEIRQKFLDYFRERGHEVRPSSSLVPSDDPTLLFTNAGMVQFKRVFLGQEKTGFARAVTSQKCVRAGGKHNDLEEVGKTARHHTFFEMLGNFSFGDYFKRDAVRYAWELMTDVLGLDAARLYATVHHSDDEAADLWANEVGLDAARIFRLGDKDNFWQMADTGPCGPCSELHYDLRDVVPAEQTTEEFVAAGDRGDIVELWNLVFMQYDRDAEGTLHPLPAPSIDTGAGLERVTAVLQGVDSNYHTDLFRPLLDRVGEVVGRAYDPTRTESVSYRVLADHARAVAFLLADGVFPSNEGRGYVLRRILRRAVRHAWLLGLREAALVHVVDAVVDTMADVYPELAQRRQHLLQTTRGEEERFLATIEGGMGRFDELAPQGGDTSTPVPGAEVFKLYDTFGFPLDLTQLMAEERGYEVDVEGFERALEEQRSRSRADRVASGIAVADDTDGDGWHEMSPQSQAFVGYHTTQVHTDVLAWRMEDGVLGLILRENPFYVESGGQVSDGGEVRGEGWVLRVTDVRKVDGRSALFGTVEGSFPADPVSPLSVDAVVPADVRRDTERNHTATHLLHAALRAALGEHVVQRGSLVAPDRLRFDFAHTAPLTPEEREEVEAMVNRGVWADHPVEIGERPYADAVREGAMALFGEKYGDVVRVVRIPDVSMELCGGTHVRHTGEIGLFRLVSESGVAAGVRRVEALTGPGAFRFLKDQEARLEEAARVLKTQPDNLAHRAEQILDEKAELETLLDELRSGGGAGETEVVAEVVQGDGVSAAYRGIRLRSRGAEDARKWGDAFLASGQSGVTVLDAELPGGKRTLFAFVTDDLITRGVRADAVVREVATLVGGKGGGRPHLAQAGVENPEALDDALKAGVDVVRRLLSGAAS
ncbi:MAG TPA: alanine--tRNA ligase [Longimicrobiales bacterium]|nr:alanine--tRNA ligase [Longimicrobiales bacterium]